MWGYEDYDPNLVEVHVSALRRKTEAHGPRLIHTVRGLGYVLRPVTGRTSTAPRLAPASSLRGRVRLAVVGLLALLLVLLFVAVDVALVPGWTPTCAPGSPTGWRWPSSSPAASTRRSWADQLEGDGVFEQVCQSDTGYCASTRVAPTPPGVTDPSSDRASRGPGAPAGHGGPAGEQQLLQQGDTLYLVADLRDGDRLTLQVRLQRRQRHPVEAGGASRSSAASPPSHWPGSRWGASSARRCAPSTT